MPRHADFSLISHFAEAFNMLRTNIRFAKLDTPIKVLLVTGAAPREGKTTVAVNLAESYAFSGQKVLLVECDLRLLTFKDLFPSDPKKGLSSLISETFDTPVEKGDLGRLSMGDLMTLIDLQEKTGTLTIANHSDAYQFSFERGKLVASVWKNRPKDKRLAAVLISSGRITEEQAGEALNRAAETGQRLGFILVNMGIVSPDHLRGPIRLQIMDTLSRAFNLSEARYHFETSSHVMYERNLIDPIGFRDILTDEVPGLRIRPFLYDQIAASTIETDIKNLHVLPGGPTPPNPSEMLGSRRMAALMSMLKDAFNYDVLIIDSPPVTSVSDASILSALSDGVIMVVGAGGVNRAIIHKAVDQLKQANAPILGFVLNRMNPKEERYYYRYYYKYRDYYYKGKKSSKE
ncbi:MAG: polysaccharide biosynthesis tyrosine autokinase [Deltaproteobacteria bacterium]|nr:polysaccharide biosynthesis tyrosine autokinase [Deltaproteobacteria bacterium]MBW2075462.1 polysaccharide biosynthesis tyrosine autokinase [Deltaproteobacteria bacterium]